MKKYNTENIFSICDKETNRNYIFYNTTSFPSIIHPKLSTRFDNTPMNIRFIASF